MKKIFLAAVLLASVFSAIGLAADEREADSSEFLEQPASVLSPVDCALAWLNYFQCLLKYGTMAGEFCQGELDTAQQCDWSLRRRARVPKSPA